LLNFFGILIRMMILIRMIYLLLDERFFVFPVFVLLIL